jgi:hypothetical protein
MTGKSNKYPVKERVKAKELTAEAQRRRDVKAKGELCIARFSYFISSLYFSASLRLCGKI